MPVGTTGCLSNVFHGPLHKAVQRHAGLPHFQYFIEKLLTPEELFWHCVAGAVVFVFQQVGMFPVGRVAFGDTLQLLHGEKLRAEVFLVGRVVDNGEELVGAVEYLLADGVESFRCGHKDAAAEVTGALQAVGLLGAQLKVVAWHAAVLRSPAAEEAGDMGFVGCLVGREAGVAVDSVDGVLRRQAHQRVIIFHHLVDKALGKNLELFLDGYPAVLVVVEPRPIVVLCQLL